MKLLILGSDSRAHALTWKLFNSPTAGEISCAPGNGGTAPLASAPDFEPSDIAGIARWAFDESIGMVIPSYGLPLQLGLVDEAVSLGVNVCGPSQRAATMAYSRCATKAFMLRHKLPTPAGRPFDNLDTAERFLATQPMPVIIKADNPTLGEQVFDDRYAAIAGLHELFKARPLQGDNAGVVVESFIRGPRVVFSALTDGRTSLPLLPTRIYDRVDERDAGMHAPGIGAHTNHSKYASMLGDYMHQKLIQPIVESLAKDGLPYWGLLSIDCIIGADGPKLTGLRTTFHRGEAEVLLPRLKDDLLPLLQAAITQRLHDMPAPRFSPQASVGLGLFARGYPNYFASGGTIQGAEDLAQGVLLFHSDTERPQVSMGGGFLGGFGFGASASTASSEARITGGQPVTVVTLASTLAEARAAAMANAERIRFDGRSYRQSVAEREFA